MNEPITTDIRGLLADINWTEIIDHMQTSAGGVIDGDWLDAWHEAASNACDAIDSVHANLERENASLRRELDRVLCEQEDRDGLVRLPVDADGEYIHIGDVMEGVDKYDSLKKVMGQVITVSFESDGITDVAIQSWSSDGKSWHRAYLDPDASVYRHYHAPTVEDVLREFADEMNQNLGMYTGEAIDADEWRDADAKTIAEYAAKLRLAGDGA